MGLDGGNLSFKTLGVCETTKVQASAFVVYHI